MQSLSALFSVMAFFSPEPNRCVPSQLWIREKMGPRCRGRIFLTLLPLASGDGEVLERRIKEVSVLST
ncbi:hypothetical protein SLEP1_g43928 [Rubroshorea leprosula]|uniref:Secreted protein n=1 Tax=Rubroshorea leprosula TaxID=152421 RepID=A0AAV5LEL3_9ROSI|nr:hypothetical protein SLEP1_g43928 [Rubroshorea leprosula]